VSQIWLRILGANCICLVCLGPRPHAQLYRVNRACFVYKKVPGLVDRPQHVLDQRAAGLSPASIPNPFVQTAARSTIHIPFPAVARYVSVGCSNLSVIASGRRSIAAGERHGQIQHPSAVVCTAEIRKASPSPPIFLLSDRHVWTGTRRGRIVEVGR
jgi:hypothetical protein